MSARPQRNWAFLNLLAIASIKQRRALLETISVQQLKTLLEVIYNVIHNRAVIPSDTFIKSYYKIVTFLGNWLRRRVRTRKPCYGDGMDFPPLLPELSNQSTEYVLVPKEEYLRLKEECKPTKDMKKDKRMGVIGKSGESKPPGVKSTWISI